VRNARGAGEQEGPGLPDVIADPIVEAMGEDEIQALRADLGTGEAMLFTGAGFSSTALDRRGKPVPSTEEITRELWTLCFGDEEQDESSLTDLFHHATRNCPDRLESLLRERLRVCEERLPPFYELWFSVPWKRAWTLNVDDIEHAAARRFRLPREVKSISALATRFDRALLTGEALPVIHLNGCVEDGPKKITFSTTQYGGRLARSDPWYRLFVEDLVSHPFVIVGTRLEEAPFWRNLHKVFGGEGDVPVEAHSAYIVTPKLTRARQTLLEDLGITWLQMSAEEFAEKVLREPFVSRSRGTERPRVEA
jgi:hypothetical protein